MVAHILKIAEVNMAPVALGRRGDISDGEVARGPRGDISDEKDCARRPHLFSIMSGYRPIMCVNLMLSGFKKILRSHRKRFEKCIKIIEKKV